MKLIKIRGIQVYLHPSWFIAFGVITWSLSQSYFPKIAPELLISQHWLLGIVSTLLLFLSILYHEIAHTVLSLKYKVPVEKITLHIFGGVAKFKHEIPSPIHEIIISAAGPLMSLFLALGFKLLELKYIGNYLVEINLTIAFLNILPVFPMDGGRILRDVLWIVTGRYLRSTELAVKSGMFFSKLFIVIGVALIIFKSSGQGIWLIVIGVFLIIAGTHYKQQVNNSNSLKGKVNEFMIPENNVVKIPSHFKVKEFYNYFMRYGFHCFPVTDTDNMVIGMVTYWHIKENCKNNDDLITEYMQPIMNGKSITVSRKTSIVEAYEKMIFKNMNRLFVYKENEFIGLLSKSTILRILSEPQIN